MFVYDLVKAIVSRYEPNSKNEFEVLDKIAAIFR